MAATNASRRWIAVLAAIGVLVGCDAYEPRREATRTIARATPPGDGPCSRAHERLAAGVFETTCDVRITRDWDAYVHWLRNAFEPHYALCQLSNRSVTLVRDAGGDLYTVQLERLDNQEPNIVRVHFQSVPW